MAKNTLSVKPQKLQKHSERQHAVLSASGANRWINCPPSARLEEQYGEQKTSVYAQEGTVAHELSELYIRHDILNNILDADFDSGLERIMANELFDTEMLEVIPIYVDYVATEVRAAKETNQFAIAEIEQQLDLTKYVPESFGTADCVIINDGMMEVIDLKYGKGVPVYATHNVQLMLYGLGALRKYDTLFDIVSVKLTIVQPRIDNISSWEISTEDLLSWAADELIPVAKLAFAGKGELNAGDWCKFCAIKNRCKALYQKNIELAKYDFKEAALLTDEEIADILEKTPALVEWASAIHEYAQERAIHQGKIWPGFKLVRGVSRRKWVDEEKAAEAILAKMPEATEDDIYNLKLKSITELEKTFGKKVIADKLSDVIVKPEGKPTLVPLSDKRQAIGVEEAIDDFK